MRKDIKKAIRSELDAIAFSDFTRFVRLDTLRDGTQVMTVTDTSMLRKNERRAVASIRAGTKGIEIKLCDKLKALELLGKACGFFEGRRFDEEDTIDRLRELLEESDDSEADD